jgi:hypothetical protein
MKPLIDPPLDEGRPHAGLSWSSDTGKSLTFSREVWADFLRWLTSEGGLDRWVPPSD